MSVVVITGSTKGIGFGLADEFLKSGCSVVISGRTQERVNQAVEKLSATHDASRIFGKACDVGQFEQLQALWDETKAHLGNIDFWINNAAIDVSKIAVWDVPQKDIDAIVNTNLLGVMYASKIAMLGMREQGHGQIFNMEGLGSDGRKSDGYAIYGATKSALTYFTKSLSQEAKDTPVKVGTISPGMVVTELLVQNYQDDPADFERAKKILNILADKVETVTPYLVEQVLQNTKNGAAIKWLTTPKIIKRFMTARFNKRDLFSEPSA